jgi:hypothetical protein
VSTEQDQRTGSVAHAFGQALAFKWAPALPTAIKRTGLPILLYALRQLANAAGELRFAGDGKPIRVRQIAAAACCAEKDARRFLDAAIVAGVVQVVGERKRGSITVYRLIVTPWPDWEAAASYLRANPRKSGTARTVWQQDDTAESSGHRDPNSPEPTSGHRDPNFEAPDETEVRVTATHWSSGHRDPLSSGHRDPNNPCISHEYSHEVAEVVTQPQVPGGHAPDETPHEDTGAAPRAEPATQLPADFIRCTVCHRPMLPRPGRTAHRDCTTARTA